MARLPFTLEQLTTFVAVAQQQSMSAAARSLYLTQGAVSQQVANLEAALGLRLLERAGRRARLTEAGREIAAACEAAIRSVDAVAEQARRLTSLEAGSLHIGASPTSAAHYLPALLASFTAVYPGVRIKVVTENTPAVSAKVASGVLDCAMVEADEGEHDLVRSPIAEDEVLLVVAPNHPLGKLRHFDIEELVRHRYVGREPGAAMEAIAVEVFASRYDSLARIELGHLDAVRGATLAGLGYAVLPRIAIARELAEGRLKELPIAPRKRWISLLRRPSSGTPTLEEFWRLATAHAPV